MFISESLGLNESGHLTFGGHDTVDLAKKYKTPVYIMDEVLIRKNCRKFVNSMNENYNSNGRVIYASGGAGSGEMLITVTAMQNGEQVYLEYLLYSTDIQPIEVFKISDSLVAEIPDKFAK